MKQNLLIIASLALTTSLTAQSNVLHVPNGTSGISSTVTNRGVGVGLNTPDAKLHIRDDFNDGTVLLLEAERTERLLSGGGMLISNPDYFIHCKRKLPNGLPIPAVAFSVDWGGKIQSGLFSANATEQLALVNNMAIYRGGGQKIRLELSNNEPRFLWKSPGNNFQFANEDNATVALQLGEDGQVGVNTGTFTSAHKFHVEGGALSDYSVVQPAADWGTGADYVGIYFTDRPELRWNSDGSNYFEFKAADTGEIPLRLTSSGKVGINTDDFFGDHDLFVDGSVYIIKDDTDSSPYSLLIEGTAIAEEMFIRLKDGTWGDFVFEKEYNLMPLDELENYLEENKHLPDFPSAAEVEKDGLALGETERLLTIKVEELTLYILELKKEIDTLREEIKD